MCNYENCQRNAVVDDEKCILHCKKSDYQSDKHKPGFLESFFNELIEYIVSNVFQTRGEEVFPNSAQVRGILNNTSRDGYRREQIINFIKDQSINFNNILFPERDSRDTFDYYKPLEMLREVSFNFCEFYVSSLDFRNVKVFFDECIYYKHWYLYNHKLLENNRNVLYQVCTFKEGVSTVAEDYVRPELDNPIFSDCIFEKELILENVTLKNRLFKNTEYKLLSIKKMDLLGCTFNDKFILNNYIVEKYTCINSFFNEKVEFKWNRVDFFEINNTNFSKLVDCYKTSYKQFQIKKSIFEDFVNFEECEFGVAENTKDKDFVALFLYATMMSFINFRKSNFISGLDLAHINLKEPPNFLNAKVSPDNSNRETFRIIKYSFDKVGNYIEANKFYELEMLKLKEELIAKKKRSTYFLLKIYEITSNYGQSYSRPIFLTLLSSLAYWLLIVGYEKNILYSILPSANRRIESIAVFVNGVSSHIMPISKVLKEGMEFISLLFYIIFTSLIWLVILAIKRGTKR